jgi:sulfide:quinone oxidoreductase
MAFAGCHYQFYGWWVYNGEFVIAIYSHFIKSFVMTSNHYQILIVGGGNAGISIAAQLLLKKRDLKLAILEPSDKHLYQPAWTLVGGGTYNVEKTIRNQKDVIPKGATWLQERVESIDPENNRLATQKGNNYTYDYLIVAPGIQLNWHKIKGLAETIGKNNVVSNYRVDLAPLTYKAAQTIKKGDRAIFTSPNTAVKCGGAPQKTLYLLSDYFRKKGILKDVDVQFISGGTIIFGIPRYAVTLQKVVDRYGIKTRFHTNLVEVDGPNQIAWFQDKEGNRFEEKFNMLHVTPPMSAPDFIKNSPLANPSDIMGFVDVDKHTLKHMRFGNVFAAGDVTNTPNAKTGAAIKKQAPVLVANLLNLMEGKAMTASYNGYGSCPLITGYGKLVLAEFGYDKEVMETFPFDQSKERWTMWILKKYILPWMYWNRILTGKA